MGHGLGLGSYVALGNDRNFCSWHPGQLGGTTFGQGQTLSKVRGADLRLVMPVSTLLKLENSDGQFLCLV